MQYNVMLCSHAKFMVFFLDQQCGTHRAPSVHPRKKKGYKFSEDGTQQEQIIH
jgi:hypothetical protein